MSMLSTNVGIDLGTSSVLVYIRKKGIVLREPSVVAINTQEDNQVVAVGEEARMMIGRTPKHLASLRLSGRSARVLFPTSNIPRKC